MPKIKLTKRFVKAYIHLPASLREKIDKQIELLAENPRHPSLQSKPIQGAPGIYEARIDQDYRLTYQRLPGDVFLIRVVGKHDVTLKNP